MKPLQHTKVAAAIPPAAIKDNAAFSSLVIDRQDFPGMSYGEFHICLGATDVALSALKVQESDAKTDATTLGGTPSDVLDLTSKPAAGDDNEVWIVGIDFSKSRQRYFQLQGTAGDGTNGTYLSAHFIGERTTEAGTTAAKRGAGYVEYV
jgi:hypothetical protein